MAVAIRSELRFILNGRDVALTDVAPDQTLLDWLRISRSLKGTKEGCAEGDCGACTVVLRKNVGGALRYQPVNACILLAGQADGAEVITVEDLAATNTNGDALHPVHEQHGAQCGFCTPGIVMSLSLRALQGAAALTAGEALAGNLCRCTGYLPILNAARVAEETTAPPEELLAHVPAPEVVRELEDGARSSVIVRLRSGEGEWFLLRPATLAEAVAVRAEYPNATIIAGGTDVRESGGDVLYLGQIAELMGIESTGGSLHVGAAVTWDRLRMATEGAFPELSRYLRRFGSPQIRAMGTVGGSIVSRAPNADILPLLLVQGASVRFAGAGGERQVSVADLLAGSPSRDEILTRLILPLPAPDESIRLYKVARRRAFDRSVFCAAVVMRHGDDGRITEARIACGGGGPVAQRLTACERALQQGAAFTPEVMRVAGEAAAAEITPVDDAYAGAEYRRLLAANLPLRFYHDTLDAERRRA